MNLFQLFSLSLEGRARETALEYYDRGGRLHSLTFGDVDRGAAQYAALLGAKGMRRGDRLCVYLPNCLELILLYLACARSGVIFVPVNILYKRREMEHILGDAAPKAVVSREPIATRLPVWDAEEFAREAEGREPAAPAALEGNDAAAIVYTSGTTGDSKGAILTHHNFVTNAVNLLAAWKITAADRLLLPLPLFHVHGLGNGLHCWLAAGFRLRLLERFERATIGEQLREFRPTVFFGVPTMYVRLLEACEADAGESMRLWVSGSAPLAAQTLEDFRAKFGHTILERYGMTETLMNAGNPYEGERRAGTVGFPMPGVSLRIDGGEILVRGPNVFAGYWGREQASRDAFEDGWFRTGDMGARSEDGYYTLHGRKSDLIISGGFNIYPREIEEFLLEQPEVCEAAVLGVADKVRGETPVAYVVAREGFDAGAMEARCREAMASFKIPRAFVSVDKMPRNALGKVQKHLLPRWEPQ